MLQNYKQRLYVFKINKLRTAILFVFSFGFINSYAQTAVTTAGGNSAGTQGSVSYSIGQTVYTTTTGTNGSVAQGFQLFRASTKLKALNLTVARIQIQ